MPVSFPSTLKPITNQGYDFGTANNLFQVDTLGGIPIVARDYKYGVVLVNCVIVGDRLVKQVMTDFYYAKINSGADKFYMNLDTGFGIEQHTCQIVPASMSWNGSQDPTWTITFTVRCERTPAQDNPYDGSLSDLYAEYGEETASVLDALDIFVNDTLE